jgi:1-phosphofructokinase
VDRRGRGSTLRAPPPRRRSLVIVTVTPNPSIDRTLRIPPLARGRVIRAVSASAEAGGKGINVARALALHGEATVAVAPLSTASAATFLALLGAAAPLDAVPVASPARVNVSLVEDDGTVTKVNEPGPELSAAEVEALVARVASLSHGAAWVAGCGSLPPGAPPALYAQIASRLPAGVRVAIDADGIALREAAGAGVALLKPNLTELEGLVGASLPTLGAAIEAARGLVDGGIGGVLVSLGPDGAAYVDSEGATHAEAYIDDLVNTVGAGDALLAGFLAAGGVHAGLRTAVAWSVAACRSPGSQMRKVTARDAEGVQVHDVLRADRRFAA